MRGFHPLRQMRGKRFPPNGCLAGIALDHHSPLWLCQPLYVHQRALTLTPGQRRIAMSEPAYILSRVKFLKCLNRRLSAEGGQYRHPPSPLTEMTHLAVKIDLLAADPSYVGDDKDVKQG